MSRTKDQIMANLERIKAKYRELEDQCTKTAWSLMFGTGTERDIAVRTYLDSPKDVRILILAELDELGTKQ